jgi:hypothetical protein
VRDEMTSRNSAPANRNQFDEARARLEKVVVEGLRHGFFDCSIACEIGNGGKRQLVIRAGKSHKFTIPEDEVPR